MESFQLLRLADVCAIFRLLNDLRALRFQRPLWEQPMLAGLCGLIGAQVGSSLRSFGRTPAELARSVVSIANYTREKQRESLPQGPLRNNPGDYASRPEIIRLITDTRTLACRQASADRPWCISGPVPATCKDSYNGNFIISYRRFMDPSRHHWLVLLRQGTSRPFQHRHRRMVQLFHQELAHITPLDTASGTGPAAMKQLSPRLRQTLELLGTGLAEKQVAAELGCSCNTVHGYVKELHRRFAVSTRSELLVRLYETRGLAQA